MSSYFWNGFQHVLVGLVFAAAYGRAARGLYLRSWSFWAGIIFTSGALFFVPLHIAAFGSFTDWLYQFVHYPLADWDILFLGMSWHRFFLTHSFVIPILVWAAVLDFKKLHPLVFGMVVGHASPFVLGRRDLSHVHTGGFLGPMAGNSRHYRQELVAG